MSKKERKKSTFFADFKKFITEGNAISMAVGVIIGAAMKDLVSSLVENIFNPIIGIFTGRVDFSKLAIKIGDDLTIRYGAFLTAFINFIILAFVVFLIVRIINKFNERIKEIAIAKKGEEVEEPTTKTCPFCQSEISIKAIRCPHCTSVLEQEDEEALSN